MLRLVLLLLSLASPFSPSAGTDVVGNWDPLGGSSTDVTGGWDPLG
jgi:hypothetical protein